MIYCTVALLDPVFEDGVGGYRLGFRGEGGPVSRYRDWGSHRQRGIHNPLELRKKEYFLTHKGRSLIHEFKRQLSKEAGENNAAKTCFLFGSCTKQRREVNGRHNGNSLGVGGA
jgi:hypothetical protein